MNIPKYDMGYYSKHSFKRPIFPCHLGNMSRTERNSLFQLGFCTGKLMLGRRSGFILGPLMADFQVRTGGFRFREFVLRRKKTSAFKVTLRIVDQGVIY